VAKEALTGVVAGTGGPELRFLVDENAARIVRWLRLMGYDTSYLPGVADGTLVARARDEQRVLLTRDRGIMARREIAGGQACALLLASDHTWQQLEQVVRTFNLDPARAPFSRCAACNGVLERVSPAEASAYVPPFVAATQTQFTRCPGCGRFYWRGTHWHRVSARLASLGRPTPLRAVVRGNDEPGN
jgi:uncharacterized protein with PIN domain